MIHGEIDEQHDKHLIQVLNKCCEIGLKLNPEKCSFGQKEVKFYGNAVSSDGVKPDPKKVDIIIQVPSPQNKTELASYFRNVQLLKFLHSPSFWHHSHTKATK